jgi:hypothetical protein
MPSFPNGVSLAMRRPAVKGKESVHEMESNCLGMYIS